MPGSGLSISRADEVCKVAEGEPRLGSGCLHRRLEIRLRWEAIDFASCRCAPGFCSVGLRWRKHITGVKIVAAASDNKWCVSTFKFKASLSQ